MTTVASLKVAKKFAPGQKGTLMLARRYGPALVCVRHRHDTATGHRYTTVELVVDSAPIRGWEDQTVGVRIGYYEKSAQARARAQGARWDPDAKLWRMTRRAVRELGMEGRVLAPTQSRGEKGQRDE